MKAMNKSVIIIVLSLILNLNGFSQNDTQKTIYINKYYDILNETDGTIIIENQTLKLSTLKNTKLLVKNFIVAFGSNYRIDSSQRNTTNYRWNNVKLLNYDSVDVCLYIETFRSSYIQIGAYHPTLKIINNNPDIFEYFNKLCIKSLEQSEDVKKAKPIALDLSSHDSLMLIYNYLNNEILSNNNSNFSLHIDLDIDSTGKISNIESDGDQVVFKKCMKLLNKCSFPSVYFYAVKKKVKYYLKWTFVNGNYLDIKNETYKWEGQLDSMINEKYIVEGNLFNQNNRKFIIATSEYDQFIHFYERLRNDSIVFLCKLNRMHQYFYGDYMIKDIDNDGKYELWLLDGCTPYNNKVAEVFILDQQTNNIKYSGETGVIYSYNVNNKGYYYYNYFFDNNISKVKCKWENRRIIPLKKITYKGVELNGESYYNIYNYDSNTLQWIFEKMINGYNLDLKTYDL